MPDWLGNLAQDIRVALRSLRRTLGFAFIAVLSLAVGIGVNTALFSYVHAAFLQPVAGVNGPDRVVEVLLTQQGQEQQEWTYPDFQDVREAETPLVALAGWKEREGALSSVDRSQLVHLTYVSANYFQVLGVVPSLGRDFLPAEDVGPGQQPVAILSHALWQSRFNGDADVIGRTISVNRTSYTVVGVAPESFTGHRPFVGGTDLWLPIMQHPFIAGERDFLGDRNAQWLQVLGRLRPSATTEQANVALETVFAGLAQEYPETNRDRSATAYPFGPIPAFGRSGSVMFTGGLLAMTGLVLLIICGNVAGMMLSRSVTREREIAVRMALGSGRARLVRHLMVEALLVAVAGGALGILFAFWGTGASAFLALDLGSVALRFRPNPPILILTLGLTLVTTLAIGLLPAIRFSKPDLLSSLKDDAGGGGRRVGRIHRVAASAQTGLALLFLVACGLALRAMGVMDRRDLGFEPQNLIVASLDLSSSGYKTSADASALLDRIRDAVGSLPGVASASIADGVPIDLVGNFTSVSRADQPDDDGGRVRVEFTRATEDYFQTIGTPLHQGRGFDLRDDASSDPVVVITQSLADRLWPAEDALGRRLSLTLGREAAREYTVVGVAANAASSRPTEDWPHVFVSLRQHYAPRVKVVARTTMDYAALVSPVQSAILDADPALPVPVVVASETLVSRSTEGQRAWARVAGGLGLLALLLSAIGVYGVVAFAVASRSREIGLRMALGATRERMLGTVLRDALWLAIPGLAVGALVAAGLGFGMQSMLLGVSPADPLAFGLATGVLLLVVLAASLVPARRASRIDPMTALRAE